MNPQCSALMYKKIMTRAKPVPQRRPLSGAPTSPLWALPTHQEGPIKIFKKRALDFHHGCEPIIYLNTVSQMLRLWILKE